MRTDASRRDGGIWGKGASVAALLAVGLSCGELGEPLAAGPKARLLVEPELPLLMTHLGPYSKRLVTSSKTVPVRFYFDPELVDLSKVEAYSLWSQDSSTKAWHRIGTTSPDALPLEIEPEEGLIGLRASVTYSDGTEKLVPRTGDEPAMWLCVDRSAPVLTWVSPRAESSIRGYRTVRLEWSADELQFGETKARLEWSADRGTTWKRIGEAPQAPGKMHFAWRLPEEVCSDILVRVISKDMTGHESSAVLALNYPGSVLGAGAVLVDSAKPAPGAPPPAAPAARAAAKELAKERPETEEATPVPASAKEDEAHVETSAGPEEELAANDEAGAPTTDCPDEAPQASAPVDRAPRASLPAPPPPQPRPIAAAGMAADSSEAADDQPRLPPASLEPTPASSRPVEVVLGEVPALTNGVLSIPVSFQGPTEGSPALQVSLRKAGAAAWSVVDSSRVRWSGSSRTPLLAVDLSTEPEGFYDVRVRAAGQGSSVEAPGGDAARFQIDRTPPSLVAKPPAEEWLAGLEGEAQVDVDWLDAVPPLVLEGRQPDGGWKEVGQWGSIPPGEKRFAFVIPAGVQEYAVRFSAADRAGNRAQVVVGPRSVEPPVRLKSFLDSRTYPSRSSEKIIWEIHPAAERWSSDLRVSIAHLPRRGAEWSVLYDDLPATADCYWDLPPGDSQEHRLRLRLSWRGKVLHEETTPAFLIGGTDQVVPTVVRIKDDSVFYSDRGKSALEKYAAASERKDAPRAAELDAMASEALSAFKRALEVDPNNYHATYGLAQLLNRTGGEGEAPEVKRWLQRTVEIKPDHAWALNDLGAAHIRDGEYAKAEAALAKCASIESSPIVLYNLGLALFYGGKTAEARDRFEAALKGGATRAVPEGEIYYYLVQAYLRAGDMEHARGLFREKSSVMPEDLRAEIEKALQG